MAKDLFSGAAVTTKYGPTAYSLKETPAAPKKPNRVKANSSATPLTNGSLGQVFLAATPKGKRPELSAVVKTVGAAPSPNHEVQVKLQDHRIKAVHAAPKVDFSLDDLARLAALQCPKDSALAPFKKDALKILTTVASNPMAALEEWKNLNGPLLEAGGYALNLLLLRAFYEDGNIQKPIVLTYEPRQDAQDPRWDVWNDTGISLVGLNQQGAGQFFLQAVESCLLCGDPSGAASGLMNMVEDASHRDLAMMGTLAQSAMDMAHSALAAAEKLPAFTPVEKVTQSDATARAQAKITDAMTYQAWHLNLTGRPQEGLALFEQAVQRQNGEPLTDMWELWHARTLFNAHGAAAQERVTAMAHAVIHAAGKNPSGAAAQCYSLLGTLAQPSDHDAAGKHHAHAVRLLQGTSVKHVQVEVLLDRAQFHLHLGMKPEARRDLNAALALMEGQPPELLLARFQAVQVLLNAPQ